MDSDGVVHNSNATEKLEAMQSELHCGICHDYFVQAFTLSCSHSFCRNCINAWRAHHTDCPVCRRETVGMAPSRALDNIVAALNGGVNNSNGSVNEDSPNVGAWFSTPHYNLQPNQAIQPDTETDTSYNESDEGTFYDSEEEEVGEDNDADYDGDDDYYDDEEETNEDEGEEEDDEEEGEEEGEYEDDESSYSEEEFDEDDFYDDDEEYNKHVKRSNQNNPNNEEYWKLRGWPNRPSNWREIIRRE